MRSIVSCFAVATLAGCASSLGDIPGPWELRTSIFGRSNCVLSFSGAPGIAHGTVTATGFCPQIFAALPQWRIDAGRVVISNRQGDTLAELAAGYGHLDGRTVTGQAISLTR
jgi:Protease inhibitor Inh